jgi:hypothetical protein
MFSMSGRLTFSTWRYKKSSADRATFWVEAATLFLVAKWDR